MQHSASRLKKIITTIIFTFNIPFIFAFEFDAKIFTDLGESQIDLTRFSGPVNQYHGFYYADIYINDLLIHQNYQIQLATINDQTTLCFTPEILNELPIKQQDLKLKSDKNDQSCPTLTEQNTDIQITYIGKNSKLDLIFPHKYLGNFDAGWAPVGTRDHGISGLVFDYDLIFSHNKRKYNNYSTESNTHRSYGTAGANIGRYRLRADYQYYKDRNDTHFKWDKIYAFTDIGSINSKLYAGEIYTNSNLFDTFRLKGISLFSDEQMKPSYLRGYAPEVSGIANSSAIVTLKQYGSVIRTIQVPPGPFSITDLPSGFNGPVEVTVEEDNGQVQIYHIDIANTPFLTRKGDIRYAANIGKIAPVKDTRNVNYGNAISFDSSIGLTNTFSLLEGVMVTTNGDYQSYNLGVGMNLGSLGALSIDITHAKNKAHLKESFNGERYRINYSKRLFRYSTLSLSANHSSENYTTIQNYMSLKENQNFQNISKEKDRFILSLSQNLPSISSSISLSLSKNTYWNQNSNEYYSVSLNKQINKGALKGSSFTFSYTRNKNSYQLDTENRFALYMTIPLGNESYRNRIQYNSSYNDKTRQQSHDITYYNYYNKDNYSDHFTIGTNVYRKPDYSGGNEYSLNASYDKTSHYGKLHATAEYNNEYRRASIGFDSSITLTQHGITTSPRVHKDAARLIINGGISGVQIENSNAVTNIFGLAGVHNVSSYYPLTYKINNDTLPNEVEIHNSIFKFAVSDGAITYRSANPVTGKKGIAQIRLSNGEFPPFGTMVYLNNNFNREISMVSEEGLTYLSGIQKNSQYQLRWGADQSCHFTLKYADIADLNNIICQIE